MAKQTNEQSYDGSQIQVLEGLEPVRKRPGMYIGSTGYEGVHHLIKEIADNSIDEAIAGYATKVEVTLLEDGGVRVSDDGRGIPVDKHPKTGKSILPRLYTAISRTLAKAENIVEICKYLYRYGIVISCSV